MTPLKHALIAALLIGNASAFDASAQAHQAQKGSTSHRAVTPQAGSTLEQSAQDAADAADAAAAAAMAALEADAYNKGGYTSLTTALAIFRSRGNPADERWIKLVLLNDRWRSADLRTVRIEGHLRTVWEELPTNDGGTFKAQFKYNCTTGTHTLVRSVSFDRDGNAGDSFEHAPDPTMPVPGSNMETMTDWVCAK